MELLGKEFWEMEAQLIKDWSYDLICEWSIPPMCWTLYCLQRNHPEPFIYMVKTGLMRYGCQILGSLVEHYENINTKCIIQCCLAMREAFKPQNLKDWCSLQYGDWENDYAFVTILKKAKSLKTKSARLTDLSLQETLLPIALDEGSEFCSIWVRLLGPLPVALTNTVLFYLFADSGLYVDPSLVSDETVVIELCRMFPQRPDFERWVSLSAFLSHFPSCTAWVTMQWNYFRVDENKDILFYKNTDEEHVLGKQFHLPQYMDLEGKEYSMIELLTFSRPYMAPLLFDTCMTYFEPFVTFDNPYYVIDNENEPVLKTFMEAIKNAPWRSRYDVLLPKTIETSKCCQTD